MAKRSAVELRFFTLQQAAERLQVSIRTIRRWIAAGELTAHRFGGVIRISEQDLLVFLALHRDS